MVLIRISVSEITAEQAETVIGLQSYGYYGYYHKESFNVIFVMESFKPLIGCAFFIKKDNEQLF
ncbi:hypothetical protein BpHYR1_053273 [Brachionus plicatilis]|uniref:Uncharacterized protein n=1 Tax=Brachionus plicatilis TaxID=10195 RepID=A0A3M7T178_BRAPC|nr:hypothetical protein BpHYR1_053273 [Brachionus plicatilis]